MFLIEFHVKLISLFIWCVSKDVAEIWQVNKNNAMQRILSQMEEDKHAWVNILKQKQSFESIQ